MMRYHLGKNAFHFAVCVFVAITNYQWPVLFGYFREILCYKTKYVTFQNLRQDFLNILRHLNTLRSVFIKMCSKSKVLKELCCQNVFVLGDTLLAYD